MTLARAALSNLRPYLPAPSGARIDLSDNTNLFGVPPAATAALAAAAFDLRRYPQAYSPRLQQALASYARVPEECIVTGCGSDDVLDATFRAFLEPGEVLACSDPTFSMIPVFATVQGAEVRTLPFAAGFELDVEALLATQAKVTYLCSPNNPTGTVVSAEAIRQLVDRARGLVVIDEAYTEFSDVTYAALALQRSNVLVTRTLSKAFGLAGLRVGYAIGAPELIAAVAKARGPYKIHTLAETAAAAAVTSDVSWMRAQAQEARTVRERLLLSLKTLGLAPLPSQANFVLVPVADATAVSEALAQRGIRVRALPRLTGIGDALRITCGPWPWMEETLAALDAVLRRAA
ncbi:MAG: histidinol-phosphate transaminase [Myxococcota bacterium]|nr:histidinol-phosphate transaminase [Myxococcota bacterium]